MHARTLFDAADDRRRRGAGVVIGAVLLAVGGVPLPAAATGSPIRHIVVLYQENHSFDETLGAFCHTTVPARCDGDTGVVHLADGGDVSMRPSPDIVPNADHTVAGQVAAMDGGRMDGWNEVTSCDAAAHYQCLTYYRPDQIPALASLAARFAISDATFSMADSPSWGGHLYAAAASTDGFTGDNPEPVRGVPPGPGWGCDSRRVTTWISPAGQASLQPSCVPDPKLAAPHGGAFRSSPVAYVPTIMDRLDAAGLSWRLYSVGSGYGWAICPTFADCLDTRQRDNMVNTAAIVSDAHAGRLPSLSIVLPSDGDSQHNGRSMMRGDDGIATVINALEAGPEWDSTAVFITYDDCGCFYDHVAPGRNPDGTRQGPRVPLVIVSPYARHGFTDSTRTTFAGILTFVERTFGLQPLSRNDAAAYGFGSAFNYEQVPIEPLTLAQHPLPPGSDVASNAVDQSEDPT